MGLAHESDWEFGREESVVTLKFFGVGQSGWGAEFRFLVVYILWIQTNVYGVQHCRIIQSSFTTLKILCALLIHSSPLPPPRQALIFFNLSTFCLFQNVT